MTIAVESIYDLPPNFLVRRILGANCWYVRVTAKATIEQSDPSDVVVFHAHSSASLHSERAASRYGALPCDQ